MKISRLIKQLADLKKLHGDLPVQKMDGSKSFDVMIAAAYDDDGRGSRDPGFKGMSHVTIH